LEAPQSNPQLACIVRPDGRIFTPDMNGDFVHFAFDLPMRNGQHQLIYLDKNLQAEHVAQEEREEQNRQQLNEEFEQWPIAERQQYERGKSFPSPSMLEYSEV